MNEPVTQMNEPVTQMNEPVQMNQPVTQIDVSNANQLTDPNAFPVPPKRPSKLTLYCFASSTLSIPLWLIVILMFTFMVISGTVADASSGFNYQNCLINGNPYNCQFDNYGQMFCQYSTTVETITPPITTTFYSYNNYTANSTIDCWVKGSNVIDVDLSSFYSNAVSFTLLCAALFTVGALFLIGCCIFPCCKCLYDYQKNNYSYYY